MPNNFSQLLLQQFCTRRSTAAMAFGPLEALLFWAQLFHCFRCRDRHAWLLFGSELGSDIIMAQPASRDASHGGRGDPGKLDRCLRSAVGQERRIGAVRNISALPPTSRRSGGHVEPPVSAM